MIDEACDTPEPSGLSALHADRRAAQRHTCTLQPFWRVAGEEEADSLLAGVRDVSASGIGLLLAEPVKPGTALVINLQATPRRLSRPLPRRVRHATPQT